MARVPAPPCPRVSASSIIRTMPFPLFELVQIIYWVALSTWFGGVLFVALSAPVIFRTVREANPLLPTVLSVNLEGQHSTLLAGSIVANLIAMLRRYELACAGAIAITMAVQLANSWQSWIAGIARAAMYLAAVALVLYDWRGVWPKIDRYRQEYIDHADDPEVANPAREQFDRYHRESVLLLMIIVALLLGMIVFSADIQRAITLVSRP